MKQIDTMTFVSPITREYSGTAARDRLGVMQSSMTLYKAEDSYRYFIEWDIPTLEETYEIGIWCETGSKGPVLYDYDGVFQLPKQAQELLTRNGVTVPVGFQ